MHRIELFLIPSLLMSVFNPVTPPKDVDLDAGTWIIVFDG